MSLDMEFTAGIGDSISQIAKVQAALQGHGVAVDNLAKTVYGATKRNNEWLHSYKGFDQAGRAFVATITEECNVMGLAAIKFEELSNARQEAVAAAKRVFEQDIRIAKEIKAQERELDRLLKTQERAVLVARKLQESKDKATRKVAVTGVANSAFASIDPTGAVGGMNPAQIAKIQGMMQTLERTMQRSGLSAAQLQAHVNGFKVGNIPILVGKMGEVDRALRRTATGFAVLEKESKSAAGSMWLSWENVARVMQIQGWHAAFSKTASVAKESAIEFRKFQQSIALIQTITDDATNSTTAWEVALRRTSDAFNVPLLEVSAAAYNTVSNQIARSTDATKFLAVASKFGKVTNSDLTASVNILSSVINAYGTSSGDAGEIAARLFKVIDLGRVNTDQLNTSLGNQLAVAAQLGISYEEVGAALSVMTNQGVGTDTALTNLGAVMTKLLKPSKSFQEFLSGKGYDSGVAAVKAEKLYGIIQLLNEELRKGGVSAVAADLQDVRAIRFGSSFGGDKQTALFLKNHELIKNSTSQFEKAYINSVNNVGEVWERNNNRIQNILKADIGKSFLTVLTTMQSGVLAQEGTFKTFAELFKTFANVVQGVVGPLNAMTNGLGSLMGATGDSTVLTKGFSYTLIATGVVYATTNKSIQGYTASIWQNIIALKAQAAAGKGFKVSGGMVAGVGITAGIIALDQIVSIYNRATDAVGDFKVQQLAVNQAIMEGLDAALNKTLKPFGQELDRIATVANIAGSKVNIRFREATENALGPMNEEFTNLIVTVEGFKELMAAEFDPEARMKELKKDIEASGKATDGLKKNFGDLALRKFFLDKDDLRGTVALAQELTNLGQNSLLTGNIQAFRDYSDEALATWKDINKTITASLKTSEEKTLKLKEKLLGSNFNMKDAKSSIADLQGKAQAATAAKDFDKAEAFYESIDRVIDKISEKEKKAANGKSLFADKLDTENTKAMLELEEKRTTFLKEVQTTQADIQKQLKQRLDTEKALVQVQQEQFIVAEKARLARDADNATAAKQEEAAKLMKQQSAELSAAIKESADQFTKNSDLFGGMRTGLAPDKASQMIGVALQDFSGMLGIDNVKNASAAYSKNDFAGAEQALTTELINLREQRRDIDNNSDLRAKDKKLGTTVVPDTLKRIDDAEQILKQAIKSIANRESLEAAYKKLTTSDNFKNLQGNSALIEANIAALKDNRAAINANTAAIRGEKMPAFADGGWVSGAKGTDQITVRASDGEFIMPPGPAAKFAPLLESMRLGTYKSGRANSSVTTIGDIHVTVEGGSSSEEMAREFSRKIRRNFLRGNSRIG